MQRRFKQVDVFTDRPFLGNPVAVVLEGEGLSGEEMQRIARWTNLSETTFVLPPTRDGADYRLRIFTPGSELPFAGHPSVGSAYAVLEAGLVAPGPRLVQECAAGLLPIDVEGEGAARLVHVTAPRATLSPLDPRRHDALHAALGVGWKAGAVPTVVDVGPKWLIVQLADGATTRRVAPDMSRLAEFSRAERITGAVVFAELPAGSADAINLRAFAPAEGVPEDPVCGSGNASVGAYVAARAELAHLLPGYSASQGREIGRDGRVLVRWIADPEGGRARIGGRCVTCVDGSLRVA